MIVFDGSETESHLFLFRAILHLFGELFVVHMFSLYPAVRISSRPKPRKSPLPPLQVCFTMFPYTGPTDEPLTPPAPVVPAHTRCVHRP